MRTIFMALSFLVAGIMVNAQSGVYFTYDDFENNRLTYATDEPSADNKIRFNEFIAKPYLIVKHNGEKVHVFKDEIYAYKNKKDVVRTWNFTPYYFLGKGHIWIYYRDVYVSQPKGTQRVRKYFYSTYGKGEILPLTVHNLKRSFPNNDLFHIYLDAQFRSDAELAHYDRYTNKYKVNDLLEKANTGITKN
ncbi:hypothetical protein A4H97_09650 [Niastella yeongjuensis]|uniref:DUF4468 domain-containing protein n=1 Tax=Niastella yeongjuensis TaxID=354355 RepID=A0A1V9EEX8_9BACT|nr:hypothetical protein [Niastella yeongjuensis]OQP44622.1 hypothetical protein A4H97_09650 [Niastella yeongjuensis]SEO81032.1 hypothetical protein SAMN05660816_03614 [Niastella yeongjuensis]